MIQDKVNKYKEKRISEKEYLEMMYQHAEDYEEDDIIGYPDNLKHNPDAQAFYGSIHDIITEDRAAYVTRKDEEVKGVLAKESREIEQIIEDETKVDWHDNQDVKNNMEQAIEDELFE